MILFSTQKHRMTGSTDDTYILGTIIQEVEDLCKTARRAFFSALNVKKT